MQGFEDGENDDKSMLLSMSINDVNRMQLEFNEVYQSLFEQAYQRLDSALELKLKCISTCERLEKDKIQKELGIHEFKTAYKSRCGGHRHSNKIKVVEIEKLGQPEEDDGHGHGHDHDHDHDHDHNHDHDHDDDHDHDHDHSHDHSDDDSSDSHKHEHDHHKEEENT